MWFKTILRVFAALCVPDRKVLIFAIDKVADLISSF